MQAVKRVVMLVRGAIIIAPCASQCVIFIGVSTTDYHLPTPAISSSAIDSP